jgi:NAD(P)-dependent dehydrogenase (short-subunit alcohol dehydrogenase family)
LVRTTIQDLGGLDILIANAGWTRFSNFADLDALSDDEWDKCWRTNVLGVKSLIASAMPTFEANEEGGVVLVTSSIAGRTIGGSSMAYSVTKAAQLHLVKCVAKTQGAKVRCNAVLPGLLLTEWGLEYGEERIEELRQAAVLKREVSYYLSFSWDFLVLIFLLTLFYQLHRRISRTARICSSPWLRIRVSRASTSKSTQASLFSTFEISGMQGGWISSSGQGIGSGMLGILKSRVSKAPLLVLECYSRGKKRHVGLNSERSKRPLLCGD